MNDKTKPFDNAPEKIKKIIVEVVKLEAEKMYQQRPRLNSEIIEIIEKHVTKVEINED